MFDMNKDGSRWEFPHEDRAKRYRWVVITQSPQVIQLLGDNLRGFDVLYIWNVDGFFLKIFKVFGACIFFAQIPNWEMAEVEDVVDAILRLNPSRCDMTA